MGNVVSRDGTRIAFDRAGEGPAVILVAGALGDRSHPMFAHLAALLAPRFTVFNYNRRGRGESGDTPPYAVEREVEDIAALIAEAGGSASLYGISSGAVLALEAASALPAKVTKLALYEPPFILDDSRAPMPADYVAQINEFVATGRRGDAVALFMTHVGVPAEMLEQMRTAPMWAGMERVAHTLAYDGIIMGDTQSGKPLRAEVVARWAAATMPTLVVAGGESEAFFHDAARALVDILPHATYRALAGQDHAVAADALAPVLIEFFAG
jgi:pimeloyl-ACP methyl ester carboxylesterase